MRHQDDYTYQAAPQLSYVIQFLFSPPSKAKHDFSHAQNIKDGDFSALFALCFDMTSCVLIYDD